MCTVVYLAGGDPVWYSAFNCIHILGNQVTEFSIGMPSTLTKLQAHDVYTGCTTIECFISIAKSIGQICPHPDGGSYNIVEANDGANARVGTFSSNYGYSNFPLHTDTAFWQTPAKYILLWSEIHNSTPTTILHWDELLSYLSAEEIKNMNDAVFRVHTYEGINYTNLRFWCQDTSGLRFDPNIMQPANHQAFNFIESYRAALEKSTVIEHNWNQYDVLRINNWSCLHGRGVVHKKRENRKLFRIYVR